jgi:subtilisin-like proprotein convertase family protein
MRTHQQPDFALATAQTRGDAVSLRSQYPQTKTNMIRRAMLLLGFLAAAAPPWLQGQIIETQTFTTNRVVPDGNASGLHDVRSLSSSIAQLTSVKVNLKVNGEFNGDLYGYLRHSSGFSVLLNRPGRTATNSAGYDDSGLNVTFASGAANGDIHTYRGVTTPAAGSALTGTWEPDGRAVDPAVVTDASARTALLSSFNGLGASGDWTLYLVDLESGGTNQLREWGLELTGSAAPAIAWSAPSAITYGTALGASQLNAAVTYASTNVNGTYTYTPASGTVLGAGSNQTLSVVFTPADTASFLPVTNTVAITVLPATLTVTVANASKAYGAALPAFSAGYSGFVLGQGTNVLTALATVGTTATSSSPAGTYAITASGAAAANYTFNYVAGTLTITQALTTGAIATSANPARPGTNVTFTMTVTAVAPGVGTPSGSVNFRIDGSVAGSGTLSGGVATFTTNSLAVGTHTVVAEYAGDGNFVGSTNTLSPVQVINTPPVAGADTIERYASQGVKVRLSTLLANDTDADGDTLTVTVATNSANGGTITVAGDWVTYVPASGFTNVDSFTYTIADGRGGSATATVTVNIKQDNEPGVNLTITSLGGSSYRIRGSGIPGRTYRLEYSNGLTPASWQVLSGATVTADAVGVFEHTDTSGAPTRYYRSVYP